MPRRFSNLVVLVLLVFSAAVMRAHEAGLSYAEARLKPGALELTVSYDVKDVRRMLPAGVEVAGEFSERTIEQTKPALRALGATLVETIFDGEPVEPVETGVEVVANGNLKFRLVYPRPEGRRVGFRFPNLALLPATHREYFAFDNEQGAPLAENILSAEENHVLVSLSAKPAAGHALRPVAEEEPAEASKPEPMAPARSRFGGFFVLGVEHIWTGYDHLLFLFGLLVVCATFRSVAAIITCFTVAHSITLGLAALGKVDLPPSVVEPLIAASIVAVGVENLVRRGKDPRARPALTFAFGLIHGFGFASVLRELGLGADGRGVALPLFSFNLGVEAGQLAVAAVVLPVLWALRKRPVFVQRGVPALSALVTAAGLYWLLERTVFS